MREDLRTLMLADATLAGLVGTRLGWGIRLAGSGLPAVRLTQISAVPDYVHAGATGTSADRVQADCFGASMTDAVAVERALRAAVSGYRGTTGTTFFHGIFVQGIRDLPDEEADAPQAVFRVAVDLMVHHRSA